MKHLTTFLFVQLTIMQLVVAQAPEIAWEHLYCDASNTSNDDGYFALTPDGGAVMVSVAYNGMECGDKNEFGNGAEDFWVVKVDSNYAIQWQNNIGGSGNDIPWCINTTNDGGYIVAGVSNSPVSGDKTEPRIDVTGPYYSDDIWIIKLDANGNIVWQNTIGGNEIEMKPYIEQLDGGGYILSCSSNSPISGDKMEAPTGGPGNYDYWIIRLTNAGNIAWQNTIGGNYNDNTREIHPLSGGGFICAGVSFSGISGDKTQVATGSWIMQLSNTGNIIWQNTVDMFVAEVIIESDGTFMLGGTSMYTGGYENAKYKMMQLNASGTVIFTKIIDANFSVLRSIDKTLDGGYVLGGTSVGTGTDKTDEGPIPTYYAEGWDMWLIKVDSLGNREWDNALGSASDDGGAIIRQMENGDYLLYGFANNDEEGDVSDKINPQEGQWLVHLVNTACVPSTELCNSIDDTCNGTIDEDVVESITVAADGPLTFCKGGSVVLTATSYTGTALQWKRNGEDIPGATSPSYTATQSAIYTCQSTSDCGFIISSWLTVTVKGNPNATITAGGPTTFCSGGSVTLSVLPVAGCSYQWYNGASIIPGATSINYIATTTGNYRCRVTKMATGCYKNSNTIGVNVTCREEETILITSFELYPNPASDYITIQSPIERYNYSILDISGKIIEENVANAFVSTYYIGNLPAGFYQIRIVTENDISVKNFVKQ